MKRFGGRGGFGGRRGPWGRPMPEFRPEPWGEEMPEFGQGPWERPAPHFRPGPHHHHGEDRAFWFGPGRRGPFGRGGPFGGGPFGGDPFGEDGGGRRRQRRGDIKFALLELLAEQPRHGYELIKELEQRYAGFYRPSPGSVYPTLQLLEDEGHLTSDSASGKRVYTITDTGRQLLQERPERGPEGHGPRGPGFRGHGGEELHSLRESAGAFVASVMQAARHGTPEQVQAVQKLLDSTRREIYAILSRDEKDEPTPS